ncbi:Anti-sigma factor antagonist SCO3692 [Amycolatopsis camponoti]|uniref:Anti-sigma factor antagonist n=1 Tax=Amycolatopsis camponoti TaxID=2606593 RepID=A0A6I8LYI0_9PSEU|nr:STAS domain-containing protein [Amycolatopsis camponoti]VVJ22382.1 Anti-sigma factor antagonist SCO3692 [Amycolatopsis camponoti]
MTSPFSTSTEPAATGPVLTVRGELDVATAPRLRARIAELTVTAGQLLVVDLADVTFCDSSGISALIAARNVAEAAKAKVALVAVPARLTRTLTLTGLADFFPTYATAGDAIAAHA